ncbi:MAG: peptidoglycan editing factor PgeF [Alphaproteobacteria bacterium]|nr:peptidoglycan editing factor PgeF [Alphaproteobacteria bacterium]
MNGVPMNTAVLCEQLVAHTTIRHGFFTREGGVSEGLFSSLNCADNTADNPVHVTENRGRIAHSLGVTSEKLISCKQIHASRAMLIDSSWSAKNKPEADAMVTTQRNLALSILTADCAPVLLADPEGGVIAAAHAGWRGALDGVLENTIALMESCGASADRIIAAVGPCIWQDSYEVEEDFLGPFIQEDATNSRFFKQALKTDHLLFDLPGYVVAKLENIGIGFIVPSPADTLRDERRFYSHRRGVLRGAPEAGRMLSCISLT